MSCADGITWVRAGAGVFVSVAKPAPRAIIDGVLAVSRRTRGCGTTLNAAVPVTARLTARSFMSLSCPTTSSNKFTWASHTDEVQIINR